MTKAPVRRKDRKHFDFEKSMKSGLIDNFRQGDTNPRHQVYAGD